MMGSGVRIPLAAPAAVARAAHQQKAGSAWGRRDIQADMNRSLRLAFELLNGLGVVISDSRRLASQMHVALVHLGIRECRNLLLVAHISVLGINAKRNALVWRQH